MRRFRNVRGVIVNNGNDGCMSEFATWFVANALDDMR